MLCPQQHRPVEQANTGRATLEDAARGNDILLGKVNANSKPTLLVTVKPRSAGTQETRHASVVGRRSKGDWTEATVRFRSGNKQTRMCFQICGMASC